MRRVNVDVASHFQRKNMNYFELFELEVIFNIDKNLLLDKYIELQKKYNPDKAESEVELYKRTSIASEVNAAYKTLKNDYLRASYILKLKGIDIHQDEGRNYCKICPTYRN